MPPDPSSSDARIEQQSSDWIARRERGLTAEEQDQFFQWLADDPRHGEWFAKHQRVITSLRKLAHWRPEHATQPNPDLLAAPKRRSSTMLRWVLPISLAAAAVLAVVFWPAGEATVPPPPVSEPAIVRRILEDGSTIDLIGGAQVDVAYSPARRDVRLLQGEATFKVAKNVARPFVVSAGNVTFQAVGTAFNVNLQAKTVALVVTEGRVQVNSPQKESTSGLAPVRAPILEAGQRTVMALIDAAPPTIEAVPPAEIARVMAWQPRQLEFTDAPLAQVVAEFNGDNRIKIVVDDPVLALMPFGASLRSDNVEGFVRILEQNFDVKADRRDGMIVLRRSK